MAKNKYIDGRESFGIAYDWTIIEREYKKLAVPLEYHQPPIKAVLSNKYIIELSERSTGKTTNWLLVGLVMHKLYGTVVQYIRVTDDELSPSHAITLVDVIRTYNDGEYIKKLTNDEYNSIYYHWRAYYYALVDDAGNRVKVDDKPIIQCLSIDKAADYKSTYNAPTGDLIILDEFLARGRYYRPNECSDFLDLTKTIIRDRQSPVVVMLANTISLSSQYYEDMEISKEVRTLKKGDHKQIVTDGGTHIYVQILDTEVSRSKARQTVNRLFYGFSSPKLAAITGRGLYAFDPVPHIPPHDESWRLVENRIYIMSGSDLLRCDYAYNDNLGYHMEIHRATRFYDDSVILTLDGIRDSRFVYGFGTGHLKKIWNKLLIDHLIYYESNEIGSIFKEYFQKYKNTQ